MKLSLTWKIVWTRVKIYHILNIEKYIKCQASLFAYFLIWCYITVEFTLVDDSIAKHDSLSDLSTVAEYKEGAKVAIET